MSTIASLKVGFNTNIRTQTAPSSITPNVVANQLDAIADELELRGVPTLTGTTGLSTSSTQDTNLIYVKDIGLFRAETTGTTVDNLVAFSSSGNTGVWKMINMSFCEIGMAISDESTAITTGTTKMTFRMPYNMKLVEARANVNTASSSGVITVNIRQNGTSIYSTKLTIDVNQKTSTTSTTVPVYSTRDLTDDSEITFDIDAAGTGAKGLKIWLKGYRQ